MLNDDPLAAALGEVRRATRDQVTAVWQSQMERLREVLSRDYREQMARVIDERFADFEASLKPRILEARRDVVRSFGRHWHECFLRMRSADGDRDWCDALLDAAGGLSKRCAFFSVKGEAVYYQGARGFEPAPSGVPPVIPVQSAPAFLEVVLTGISAETTRTGRDLSVPLAIAFGGDVQGKAILVPVSTDQRVVGVIYAENALEQAAVEAIALIAGIILSKRVTTQESIRPSTVVRSITEEPQPAVSEPDPARTTRNLPLAQDAAPPTSSDPSPAARHQPLAASIPSSDPSLATRHSPLAPLPTGPAANAARVAASRLLLSRYAAVKAGRASGDVYTPLKIEIDDLRGRFDHPPEYLEAELVRTLAQGNAELMRR